MVDYAPAGTSVLYATTAAGDVGAGSALTIAARVPSPKKPRRVLISGRLTPADGGEEIVVALLQNGALDAPARDGRLEWHVRDSLVASPDRDVRRAGAR